jgi:hypothetical protein
MQYKYKLNHENRRPPRHSHNTKTPPPPPRILTTGHLCYHLMIGRVFYIVEQRFLRRRKLVIDERNSVLAKVSEIMTLKQLKMTATE